MFGKATSFEFRHIGASDLQSSRLRRIVENHRYHNAVN